MPLRRALSVVAEDKLTQAVLHKCVAEFLPDYKVLRSEVKGGRGNVQRELAAYSNLAKIMPVLIGVDLDHDICAPTLLTSTDWRVAMPDFALCSAVPRG